MFYIYIYIYILENRSKDFHKICYCIYFWHKKTIQIDVKLVKKQVSCLSVCPFMKTLINTLIFKKFKCILKYSLLLEPYLNWIAQHLQSFYRNVQKKSFTLRCGDKNGRIYKSDVIEDHYTNLFMENCDCKIYILKLFYNLCTPHVFFFFFLIHSHFSNRILKYFQKSSALNFMYFDFSRLIVMFTQN